jgi:hypothetical protein
MPMQIREKKEYDAELSKKGSYIRECWGSHEGRC